MAEIKVTHMEQRFLERELKRIAHLYPDKKEKGIKYTQKELNNLALCLARCETCSEATKCTLKAKVQQTDSPELDGIVYDAQCNYYHKLYGLASK